MTELARKDRRATNSPPLSEYKVPMRVLSRFSTNALKVVNVSLTCDFNFRGLPGTRWCWKETVCWSVARLRELGTSFGIVTKYSTELTLALIAPAIVIVWSRLLVVVMVVRLPVLLLMRLIPVATWTRGCSSDIGCDRCNSRHNRNM
ncbi:unnamed protein product [Microthlaspi erraticum]|uniref:Uncharacterized protein n=1 Tax=Microthlaspi erraticum TaxID=1685480 RepID=A0A6D2JAR5_9BRAS|nr:unnamed protein product [Microthlaspi erraticum]